MNPTLRGERGCSGGVATPRAVHGNRRPRAWLQHACSDLAQLYALEGPFVTIYLPTVECGHARFLAVTGGTDQPPTDGVGALLRYAD